MVRKHRGGFTLIEITVVMGVILLLMTLAVYGYRMLDRMAGNKTTETRLAVCASIFSEYQLVSNSAGIEGQQSNPAAVVVAGVWPEPSPLYQSGSRIGVGSVAYGSNDRYSIPGLNTPQPPATGAPYNYPGNNAVLYTSAIMQLCSQIPAVQSMIASLPPGAQLPINPLSPYAVYKDQSGNVLPTLSPPSVQGGHGVLVVVDGWLNPIIFVPSGGLSVTLGATLNGSWSTNVVAGTAYWVKSVDGRPFWASAGPDGRFDQGDDNLYSCPVIFVKQ